MISKAPWDGSDDAIFDASGNLLFDPWDATDADNKLAAAAPELLTALLAAQEELRLIRMKDTNIVYNLMLSTQIAVALTKAGQP